MSKIRKRRKEKGLSLGEAAEAVQTDPGNLSRIERGTQAPGVALAWRISAIYGLSLDDIYRIEDRTAEGEDAA